MRAPRITSDMVLAVRAVAEFRSYKRAEFELGITPSAVYKKVKSAGDLLETRLFIRTDEGMEVEESGRIFDREGSRAIEHLLLAEEKTRAFVRLQEGRPLIGHSTYSPPRLLSLVMNTSLDKPNGHRIEHTAGLTPWLVQGVAEGTLHAGFGFLRVHHPDLLARQLFEESLVVCMHKSHALAVKTLIRPEELAGERFIAVGRGLLPHLHQEIEEHFSEFGIMLNIVADAFAPPEAQTMVEQRAGICLIAVFAITHASLVGRPLLNPVLTSKSGIFIREDNRHPALSAFLESV